MSKVCGVTGNVTDLTARGFDRGKPGLPDRFGAGRSQPKGGRSRFAARQARVTKGVEGKSPIRWNTIDGYRTTTRKPMVENIADIRWRWTARRSAAKCWIASSPAGARQRLSLLALRLANGIAHLYWAAVEVVDAQLHLNLLGADATGLPDGQLTQRALVIMDAVGIDRVLIVETGTTPPTPEEVSPTGHVRRRFNLSQHAVAAAPHRFAWVGRVDYDDPEVEDQVARLRSAGAIALRVVPLPETPAMAAFERGEHSRLLAAARRYRLPVFVWLPGRTQLLPHYLRDFPELPFILDHAGTFFEPLPNAALRPQIDRRFQPATRHVGERLHSAAIRRVLGAVAAAHDRLAGAVGRRSRVVGRTARTLLSWPG